MADWADIPSYMVPNPTPDDREFWTGAARGELRIQRCPHCGLHQHYPRLFCSHCGLGDPEFVTASGLGTVYSFTVVRQNGVPFFKDKVPFVVATIDLDEAGARILAVLPDLDPADAAIGLRVRAVFRPAGEEFGFVDFTPV